MKERDAIQAGFHYTGMSCSAWDTEKWEETKARAQAIKKRWKGADFRVVDESCQSMHGKRPWKNIYGNEIFCKFQYTNDAEIKKIEDYISLEAYKKRQADLEVEYEAKRKELAKQEDQMTAKYQDILAHKA